MGKQYLVENTVVEKRHFKGLLCLLPVTVMAHAGGPQCTPQGRGEPSTYLSSVVSPAHSKRLPHLGASNCWS